MAGSTVRLETVGGVAVVTLDRPAVRNAIDDTMQAELIDLLDRVGADTGVRAVVLTGAGTAFCAGGDISGMERRLAAPADEVAMNGHRRLRGTRRLVETLHGLDKVTVAAVNGSAYGIGMDLALCCDFVVASEAAVFAMSYVKVGLVPDGGGLYHLPRRVGLARAKELVFSGRAVPGAEAHALGIADRLVPAESLSAEAVRWAGELSDGPAAAIALSKAILDRTFEHTPEEVLALSAQAQAICYTTAYHRTLVADFLATRTRRATEDA